MTLEDDIKSALAAEKIIIGTRVVTKALKAGNVERVILASNAPENVRKDLEHYCKLAGKTVESFNGTGKQLGVFLGKPFSVAALAIVSKKK